MTRIRDHIAYCSVGGNSRGGGGCSLVVIVAVVSAVLGVEGAKVAKIHWNPKIQETYPGQPKVPGVSQGEVGRAVPDAQAH
jgi:hypothetical protein